MDSPIIVATDLSARSDRAVDRAIMLGQTFGAPVRLVHVIRAQKAGAVDREALEAEVRASLHDPAVPVEIVLEEGSPPETIARIAAECGAGLIVAGVARYNHFTDFLLGTAVDYLVRHAKAPVLVVKQRPQTAYRRILVPCDFSSSARRALVRALELFPDAVVQVVHAFHVPFEAWSKGLDVRDEAGHEAEQEFAAFMAHPEIAALADSRLTSALGYGGTAEVVSKAIRDFRPDLVAFGTQGSSGLRHATLGSIASDLLGWVRPDTLIVPPLAE